MISVCDGGRGRAIDRNREYSQGCFLSWQLKTCLLSSLLGNRRRMAVSNGNSKPYPRVVPSTLHPGWEYQLAACFSERKARKEVNCGKKEADARGRNIRCWKWCSGSTTESGGENQNSVHLRKAIGTQHEMQFWRRGRMDAVEKRINETGQMGFSCCSERGGHKGLKQCQGKIQAGSTNWKSLFSSRNYSRKRPLFFFPPRCARKWRMRALRILFHSL